MGLLYLTMIHFFGEKFALIKKYSYFCRNEVFGYNN